MADLLLIPGRAGRSGERRLADTALATSGGIVVRIRQVVTRFRFQHARFDEFAQLFGFHVVAGSAA